MPTFIFSSSGTRVSGQGIGAHFSAYSFSGVQKEYGVDRGRNPWILNLPVYLSIKTKSKPAALVPPNDILFSTLKKDAKKLILLAEGMICSK